MNREGGLTLTQWSVLALLRKGPSALLDFTTATVTALVRRGYIEGNRGGYYVLSDKGLAVARQTQAGEAR